MTSTVTTEWVWQTVEAFLSGKDNDLQMPGTVEPAFGAALVGFVAGDDPIWNEYKEHVGPFHWTPAEAFNLAFPGANAAPGELSVISWILPQTRATKLDLRKEDKYPAERWVRSRALGEDTVNSGLRHNLVNKLTALGVQAVAPFIMPEFKTVASDKYTFASTWSERHAAYAAGHGTFGLCDGLITKVGKAMRVGSVVARLTLPPSGREYTSHREYCLFFNSGSCRKCIERCPAGALSEKGHDKNLCKAYLHGVIAPYAAERFKITGQSYGCGFCQTGVPCESGIPPRPKKAGAPA